jgi:hypothetical protein
VADGFGDVQRLTGSHGQVAVLVTDPTQASTAGTGQFGGQRLVLPVHQGGEGALSQARRGCGDDIFHGLEIEFGSGVIGAAGDDFAPLGGQLTDLAEVLGGDFGACHQPSCLALAKSTRGEWLLPFYAKGVCRAK